MKTKYIKVIFLKNKNKELLSSIETKPTKVKKQLEGGSKLGAYLGQNSMLTDS